jgi:hypothetical protein
MSLGRPSWTYRGHQDNNRKHVADAALARHVAKNVYKSTLHCSGQPLQPTNNGVVCGRGCHNDVQCNDLRRETRCTSVRVFLLGANLDTRIAASLSSCGASLHVLEVTAATFHWPASKPSWHPKTCCLLVHKDVCRSPFQTRLCAMPLREPCAMQLQIVFRPGTGKSLVPQ